MLSLFCPGGSYMYLQISTASLWVVVFSTSINEDSDSAALSHKIMHKP